MAADPPPQLVEVIQHYGGLLLALAGGLAGYGRLSSRVSALEDRVRDDRADAAATRAEDRREAALRHAEIREALAEMRADIKALPRRPND